MPVSIIIPTLNEADHLPGTLQTLRQQQPHQIIVADGGSTDATALAAREADEFVVAPRGRAVQMNAGAERATGDVLLFLHADCVLQDGALAEAERRLRRQEHRKALRIVAVTGWGQKSDRERSRAAGIDAHLVKPIDPAALATVVNG